MQSSKHIVIFSHGFGVRKDDRGLLTDIAAGIPDVAPVLFDYNEINEAENILTVSPLSRQATMLTSIIEKTRQENPEAVIDIVAHSQGCLVVALAKPSRIRKTVFLAPSLDNNLERMVALFKDRPGSFIDLLGISKLSRKDGSSTIVPAQFWKEREASDPIPLYNELSQKTELVIINAKQDDVLRNLDVKGLNEKIKVMEIDGNHQFSGDARQPLINRIKELTKVSEATKFVLVGGFVWKGTNDGKDFCDEIVKDFDEPIKVVCAQFAQPKERWDKMFGDDKEFISKNLSGKKHEIEIADPDKFIDQIKSSHIIYLKGGDPEKLTQLLQQTGNWTDQLKGKTLAGTSAGADIIAKYYYSLDDLKIKEGLGLLPIKVIVHYRSDYNAPNIDWDKAYKELKEYKEDLPVVTLAEGEFKVLYDKSSQMTTENE